MACCRTPLLNLWFEIKWSLKSNLYRNLNSNIFHDTRSFVVSDGHPEFEGAKELIKSFQSRKRSPGINTVAIIIGHRHPAKIFRLWILPLMWLGRAEATIICTLNGALWHYHMEDETKWLPFCRRRFQMHYFEWKFFHLFEILFWFIFHWRLFPRVQLTIHQRWLR